MGEGGASLRCRYSRLNKRERLCERMEGVLCRAPVRLNKLTDHRLETP